MPSQALFEINVKSSQPFLLRDMLPAPAWAPYQAPISVVARKTSAPIEAELKEGNCLKGAVVGLCLEVALAFGLYCIWHGWHLFR